ncbi:MAG: hypothetical protein ACYDAO_04260 [Thermoplasmataceae archaeon]
MSELTERNQKKNRDLAGKLILGGSAIAVAGGLGYYFIKQSTGAVGGSCSSSGSPCNSAISPYQTQFQDCANKYALVMTSIINANKASGSGITPAQQAILDQLTTCMNYNASQIAKVAHQYEPTNALTILVTSIGTAVVIAAALVGAGAFVSSVLKARAYTGSVASRNLQNAVIRQNVADVNMTPAMAGNVSADISATQSEIIATNVDTIDTMVADEVITEEVGVELADAIETAIAADDLEVEAELLAYSGA